MSSFENLSRAPVPPGWAQIGCDKGQADMAIKERALAAVAPTVTAPGRFRPGDKLLAFMEAL